MTLNVNEISFIDGEIKSTKQVLEVKKVEKYKNRI